MHCFDAAREIHEKLSELLGDEKRTFFDQPEEEVKEAPQIDPRGPPALTSLDIVAWAFLKEELVNTKESTVVKHLKERYPNLVRFTNFMDAYLKDYSGDKLSWNTSEEFSLKLVNSL